MELQSPTNATEDPMTEDSMALVELLQKSGDGDFLRAVTEAVLQILMEADVVGLIGAGRGGLKPAATTGPVWASSSHRLKAGGGQAALGLGIEVRR